jgi:hypothetical protein
MSAATPGLKLSTDMDLARGTANQVTPQVGTQALLAFCSMEFAMSLNWFILASAPVMLFNTQTLATLINRVT